MSNQYGMQKNHLQKRVHSFGMTMIVMGACFFFYYLGLFGGVSGPLSPEAIGTRLAGLGISQNHIILVFFAGFILTLVWNHLINLACFIMGTRYTCIHKGPGGKTCGLKAKKIQKAGHSQSFGKIYQCENGHCCDNARFNPVKKGTAGHTIWITALVCCLILLYQSY